MTQGASTCWHCGASLHALPLPLGRREDCPKCAASLHVCRQCDFYDPGVSKDCHEPVADEVTDKEAANFCDYFRPRSGLEGKEDKAADKSRAKLAALFNPPGESETGGGSTEAEAARRKLESVLGGGDDPET